MVPDNELFDATVSTQEGVRDKFFLDDVVCALDAALSAASLKGAVDNDPSIQAVIRPLMSYALEFAFVGEVAVNNSKYVAWSPLRCVLKEIASKSFARTAQQVDTQRALIAAIADVGPAATLGSEMEGAENAPTALDDFISRYARNLDNMGEFMKCNAGRPLPMQSALAEITSDVWGDVMGFSCNGQSPVSLHNVLTIIANRLFAKVDEVWIQFAQQTSDAIKSTINLPDNVTPYVSCAQDVKAILALRSSYTAYIVGVALTSASLRYTDIDVQGTLAPKLAKPKYVCALGAVDHLLASSGNRQGVGCQPQWVSAYCMALEALSKMPDDAEPKLALAMKEATRKVCEDLELGPAKKKTITVVKPETTDDMGASSAGSAAVSERELSESELTIHDLHHFTDTTAIEAMTVAHGRCILQDSMDAKRLGLKRSDFSVVFLKRFVSFASAHLWNLLGSDVGLERITVDLSEKELSLKVKPSSDMRLHFIGNITTVPGPGCLPLMTAFGVKIWVADGANTSISGDCLVPARLGQVVDIPDDATFEWGSTCTRFAWPSAWEISLELTDIGDDAQHCDVRVEEETRGTKLNIILSYQALGKQNYNS